MAPSKRKRSNSSVGGGRCTTFNTSESIGNTGVGEENTAPVSECPFSVEYKPNPSKKSLPNKGKKAKKYNKSGTPVQGTAPLSKQELDQKPPEDSTTVYLVKPRLAWDSLKKYRNFVVGAENFSLNEYIFVNHSNIPNGADLGAADDNKFWVARVLEIRAGDEAHVYLRVYWLYWPEELPGGRQPYHGYKELVASNHMEIIDAMTVSGRANVKHWLELDEDEDLPDLFWRQKFDYPTQTLMEVREHCKCHGYYNPDKLMYSCANCNVWLHQECLIAEVKETLYHDLVHPGPSPTNDDSDGDDAGVGDEDPKDEDSSPVTPAQKKRARKSLVSSAVAAATSTVLTPSPRNGGKLDGASATKGGKRRQAKIPSKDEIDEMFTVAIEPGSDSPTAKAHIKDLRPPSEHSKNGAEWEQMVRCLLCTGIVS